MSKIKKELIGVRFGELMVKEDLGINLGKDGRKHRWWKCACSCGSEVTASTSNLTTGNIRSCGCLRLKSSRHNHNLIGQTFGKLVVVDRCVDKSVEGVVTYWVCKCDCGNFRSVRSYVLTSGKATSCIYCSGAIKHGATRYTSSKSEKRLCNIWLHMKDRCYNPKNDNWNRYGGRGIKICQRWLDAFEIFRDWALANGYEDNLTIDRINNDGDYEPSNCRWATNKAQANNKSTNVLIEYNGEKHSLAEWSKISGINHETLRYRLIRQRWDVQRAFSLPAKATCRNGEEGCK